MNRSRLDENDEITVRLLSDPVTITTEMRSLRWKKQSRACTERVENLARYLQLTLLCLQSRVIDPHSHTTTSPAPPFCLHHPLSHYTQCIPRSCVTESAPTSLETVG
jgi:hypothetical protein